MGSKKSAFPQTQCKKTSQQWISKQKLPLRLMEDKTRYTRRPRIRNINSPGPILKGWTRNPRRVYAAMSPTAMEVFPTPLHVPATTMVLMLTSLAINLLPLWSPTLLPFGYHNYTCTMHLHQPCLLFTWHPNARIWIPTCEYPCVSYPNPNLWPQLVFPLQQEDLSPEMTPRIAPPFMPLPCINDLYCQANFCSRNSHKGGAQNAHLILKWRWINLSRLSDPYYSPKWKPAKKAPCSTIIASSLSEPKPREKWVQIQQELAKKSNKDYCTSPVKEDCNQTRV